MVWILEYIIKSLTIIVPLLLAIAFLTLAERKVLASMQRREGPNTVGIKGILQAIADGVKLFSKETILPTQANLGLFVVAPILSLILGLLSWAIIPYDDGVVLADINIGILYLMCISSISVYAILTSGWSSNSKYAFFGAIRAAAQMISYEVSIGLILIVVIMCAGSLNLTDIVRAQSDIWYIIPLFPIAVMFFISALAETNRTPFDLTEGESELVSGYNVEYSGMTFALFFLAEYSHIILMSVIFSLLFLGGWQGLDIIPFTNWLPPSFILGIKSVAITYLFIWVRATVPRMRYDQLMQLLWKVYLPLSIGCVILVASLLVI